jgi:DNA-binding IscR family transcriptional regulator
MERLAEAASYAYKEAVGVWAMVEMSRRFDAGEPGLTAAAYAEAWNIPTRVLNETLTQLEECRFVIQSGANPPMYQPARSIDKITVAEVVTCLRESGKNPSALRLDPTFRDVIERIDAHPGGPAACRIGDLVHAMHAAPPEGRSLPS